MTRLLAIQVGKMGGILLQFFCVIFLIFMTFILPSAHASGHKYSIRDQAKWKSFGVEEWSQFDPFERSIAGAKRRPYTEWKLEAKNSKIDQVLDLIAFAEAGRAEYDAIHHSATRTPGKPTGLSFAQIFKWIRDTPGQHHAIGRYQFIPSTLRRLHKRSGFALNQTFSPSVQDRLAQLLLEDAGWEKHLLGKITTNRYMDNLALIWAGLPLSNGKSAYDGYAGNRATISRAFYFGEMSKIF